MPSREAFVTRNPDTMTPIVAARGCHVGHDSQTFDENNYSAMLDTRRGGTLQRLTALPNLSSLMSVSNAEILVLDFDAISHVPSIYSVYLSSPSSAIL